MITDAHSIPVEKVLELLNSSSEKGLGDNVAANRIKSTGENILTRKKPKSILKIFVDQLLSPIIYILFAAMILAFLFSEVLEGIAILFVILITALIGFFMEWQAIRSIESLQKMVQTLSVVIRDGKEKTMPSRLLVPGDIILIKAGDVVPADARLIEQTRLSLKESMLTGESEPVQKGLDELPVNTRITDRKNMVFNGTIIARGNAKAVVIATGDKTAIGQISSLARETEHKRTPLEKKLNSLTHWLILFTLVLAVLIGLSGFLSSNDPVLMIKTGIALAVAAIPEGLPVVATITLARGMLKLSKKKVVIKKLEAVQTLGETNIICTDKTGTLTEDKMTVKKIIFKGSEVDATEIIDSKKCKDLNEDFGLDRFINVAVLCNSANTKHSNGSADAIDLALVEFAKNAGCNFSAIIKKYPEVHELPFDSNLKLMATVNREGDSFISCVKGAPESILKYCDKVLKNGQEEMIEDKNEWYSHADKMAEDGLRVLAFADKRTNQIPEEDTLLKDLILIGIAGFIDPPRNDIAQAIKTYHDAGIQVKMITGDHPGTSRKIAQEIGLVSREESNSQTILGSDYSKFENIEPNEEELLLKASVFARMLPEQKLHLVRFYQQHRGVVGMLGDGINDAPALQTADIGISMGIRGTEAAREVADVILMDDKFTALKQAIHQGRAIFENIRYFVIFLISCNLAEVISVAAASVINVPLPLLPLQILYLNLITDIFPALALGMGKGSKNIMRMRPRDADEPILTKKHWKATVLYGLSITLVVIGVVIYAHYRLNLSDIKVNNMAFYTLVMAQLFNVFNLPPARESFFINEVTANPWVWLSLLVSIFITSLGYFIPFLRETLSLTSMTLDQLIIIVVFAFASLVISQIFKRLGFVKV
ncbi:cation-transporting P-type ATPase [Gramella sp. MT6]|uniref:cation-translocating P-type ATPase n=1 Tax=Gramella sp. MT6 TaxID=2705471 RepID=UPI001C606238|nr:cation-transporting P-type ATPase [Gramella sp. MT6]QYA26749.1 cation-transporting P-type ATPase [Gramella sp. MT6]